MASLKRKLSILIGIMALLLLLSVVKLLFHFEGRRKIYRDFTEPLLVSNQQPENAKDE